MPFGTVEFAYKVLRLEEQIENIQQSTFHLLLDTCATFTLFIACPLVYVLLNGDVGPFHLLPTTILEVINRESPLAEDTVPTIVVDDVETRNQVNIPMSRLGVERVARYMSTATSPVTALMNNNNFNQNFFIATCVDCQNERKGGAKRTYLFFKRI